MNANFTNFTNTQTNFELLSFRGGFRINRELLAKVLVAKYERGEMERHQFSFPKPHVPGECPCEACDRLMSELVQVHGKVVLFD
jgi:hypothetical protein